MFLAYARTVQGVDLGCLQPFAAQAPHNSPSRLLFHGLMPQLTAMATPAYYTIVQGTLTEYDNFLRLQHQHKYLAPRPAPSLPSVSPQTRAHYFQVHLRYLYPIHPNYCPPSPVTAQPAQLLQPTLIQSVSPHFDSLDTHRYGLVLLNCNQQPHS